MREVWNVVNNRGLMLIIPVKDGKNTFVIPAGALAVLLGLIMTIPFLYKLIMFSWMKFPKQYLAMSLQVIIGQWVYHNK